MSEVFNGLFWLLVLVFISWWIASIAFVPYLIVSVLTPCIPGLKSLSDLLLACVMFPYKCSDNSNMSEVFNGLFWLLVLVFISWWIASIAFVPYLIVSVLTPCIPGLKSLSDLLLACVMFPYKCSDNMVNRRSYNSI